MQTTFQTRLELSRPGFVLLDRWGALYARVEHELFAAFCRTGQLKTLDQMKAPSCAKHRITARHFNAVAALLKGKIASKQAVDREALQRVREDLKALRKSLTTMRKLEAPLNGRQRQAWAGKKRRLARLEARERELSSGRVALCFGSRKLFRAQFDLTTHGYENHGQWRAAWQEARSNQFYLIGSKDEAGGNQNCTASIAENGTLTLRLRLPDALIEPGKGKYLLLENVWFEHGQWELYAALDAGQAISYRFLRDAKGWRVFASTARADNRPKADFQLGALGLDVNADHLALAEADRHGNLVHRFSVPCVTHGKTAGQRRDVIRVAAKTVLRYAQAAGKPLVIEKLDFSRRKQELLGKPRQARALSSFAYGAIIQALHSNALLCGVTTEEVNPAYTSVIGRVKYAKPLGVSVHQAAALAIARRGMGFREAAPARPLIPDGKGDHLIIELPVRNRSTHEWSHWAKVRSKVRETLAGWHRLRIAAARESAEGARAALVASRGPTDVGAVRLRPSNRQVDRSPGVDGTDVHRI